MAKISNFGMHTAYLLGFEKIAYVRGTSSVVSLFENRMILSGIYLQIRPDRHVYIGKTSNIIRRFERHLQNGVVMEELAFMPMHLRFLDKKEKDIIAKAERYGLALDNLLLVETPWRSQQKFEDLISDTEIESWLSENSDLTPQRNHLKEILTIFESQPFIVVNKKVLKCADKMDVILSLCEKIKMTNFYDRK